MDINCPVGLSCFSNGRYHYRPSSLLILFDYSSIRQSGAFTGRNRGNFSDVLRVRSMDAQLLAVVVEGAVVRNFNHVKATRNLPFIGVGMPEVQGAFYAIGVGVYGQKDVESGVLSIYDQGN